MLRFKLILAFAMVVVGAQCVSADECWKGRVIKKGLDKEISDATPILERPNRTGHFYGNTVRRMHYRGQVLPRPRDYYNSTRAFIKCH